MNINNKNNKKTSKLINSTKNNSTKNAIVDVPASHLYDELPRLTAEPTSTKSSRIDQSVPNEWRDPSPAFRAFSQSKSQPTIDLLIALMSFASIHFLYLGHLEFTSQRSVTLFSALLFLSVSLLAGGLYRNDKSRRLSQEITLLTTCWLVALACIGLFVFLSKTGGSISRVWLVASMSMCLGLLISVRTLQWLGIYATGNSKPLNVIVYGPSQDTHPIIQKLENDPNSNINVLETLDLFTPDSESDSNLSTLPTSETMLCNQIEKYRLTETPVDQVWIATSENLPSLTDKVSDYLFDTTVDVCVIPDQFTQRIIKAEVSNYGNIEAVNVSEVSLTPAAEQFKRIFDVSVASVALMLLSLPMLIVALLIKLESKGPVLFRQMRYGIDGREIEVLKFRSMDIHDQSTVAQATKNDSRVTRVGRVIRKTSLDELPQLFNVIQGSMSLIGPRPHAVAHNELWRQEIRGYMMRHKIKPGITGWAQVNGWRGETNTAFKMQQRVRYDLAYIKNWSPWLDVKIMLLTVAVGFVHKNAY